MIATVGPMERFKIGSVIDELELFVENVIPGLHRSPDPRVCDIALEDIRSVQGRIGRLGCYFLPGDEIPPGKRPGDIERSNGNGPSDDPSKRSLTTNGTGVQSETPGTTRYRRSKRSDSSSHRSSAKPSGLSRSFGSRRKSAVYFQARRLLLGAGIQGITAPQVAVALGKSEQHARGVLRSLVADGFAIRTGSTKKRRYYAKEAVE